MKLLLFVTLIMLNFSLFAFECEYDHNYHKKGWIIHESIEFEKYLDYYTEIIDKGLSDGTIIKDLSGNMMTDQTLDRRDLLMRVLSFDHLITDQKIMFGDYAIFRAQYEEEQFLEVRWFDGKKKHIVYNDEFLNCVSILPPHASNVIF